MKSFVEEEGLISEPRELLISSFILQNGTLIALLLLFYLQLGRFVTKKHRFLEYTPKKCFNSPVQAAVDARRKGDENLNSCVVAETMKLLANNSHCYQIIDRSQHCYSTSVTKKHMQLLIVNCSKI